jgi:hypothetical protein
LREQEVQRQRIARIVAERQQQNDGNARVSSGISHPDRRTFQQHSRIERDSISMAAIARVIRPERVRLYPTKAQVRRLVQMLDVSPTNFKKRI